MKIKSTVCEFCGFIRYGNPIVKLDSAALDKTKPILVNKNSTKMPCFQNRVTETEIVIADGMTVAFSIADETKTAVENKKLFGLKTKKATEVTPRYLTVFVKAVVTDPAGRPISRSAKPRPKDLVFTL